MVSIILLTSLPGPPEWRIQSQALEGRKEAVCSGEERSVSGTKSPAHLLSASLGPGKIILGTGAFCLRWVWLATESHENKSFWTVPEPGHC